jgi:hypothetical protein
MIAASPCIELPMRRTSATFLFALAAMAVAPAIAQHHHDPVAVVPATAPAQRFATDEVLRGHMQDVRKAVDALDHHEHGHLGPEQVKALAGNIEGHVRDIFATCKLPPEADAALHGIIAPLLQGAATLRSAPGERGAIAPMREALRRYARQFDDPGIVAGAE